MIKIKLILFLATIFSFSFDGFSQRTIDIEKGCLKTDCTITFRKGNQILKQNKFFSLVDYRLKANYPPKRTDYLNMYNDLDYVYRIKIKNHSNNKEYGGKIAFFQAYEYAENDGVCNYYQLNIPNSKFQAADNGNMACVYEYYESKKAKTTHPTWIIWISDDPDF